MARPPATRRSLVLGTAGHIDHGKTALVRALTGQDTDRLPEEKARGITIELGFAWLDLALATEPDGERAAASATAPPNENASETTSRTAPGAGTARHDTLRLAVVDVPGHERFVRTMVSGASGIDLALLVVAADEGVMPQTREHLAICALLGIEQGLVVLSKCDLADAEMRALAEDEVREALRGGPLAHAAIVAASATTGEGLAEVRAALARIVAALPARDADRRPTRIWVDRVFEKHGFGTIVTGTWTGRSREVGQPVAIEPGGRRARIRGLERHGEAILAGEAGARIALNLQGLATSELHRGDLVCEPDALLATDVFDAALHWLARDAFLDEPTPVLLLTGTGERLARAAVLGDAPLAPGERGFARLHVDGEPLHLLPGDRFVLRGFARDAGVGATIGGGHVVDVAPPRRRRHDPALLRDLERLAGGVLEEGLRVRVERAGLAGTTTTRLALETGLDRETLAGALASLAAARATGAPGGSAASGTPVAGPALVALAGERWLAADAAARLSERLREALEAFHAKEPLQPGLARATLAGRLPENVPAEVASALIARGAETGWLVVEEQLVRRSDFRPRVAPDQEPLAQALLERLRAAGLEAPSLRSLADALGAPTARLRALAHHLERKGELVAAPEELFFARPDVDALIARVVAHFERSAELDTQTLKTLIGASRRTAMPLMALLDELQITRRDGSVRRLLQREPRWARGRPPSASA